MYLTLIIYCCIIAIASALGGSLPRFIKLTHRRIQLTLSLVAGVMLGVAFLHLLPHSIQILRKPELVFYVCLFGLLFMFFMIRTFHFHQHDLAFEDDHDHSKKDLCSDEKHHVSCDEHSGAMDLSWAGLCFGLAIHTLIDGIALAAACQSEAPNIYRLAGLGIFLAILLHKPLDALSITSLMAARGWTAAQQTTVNLVFALMCPLGAMLFAVGLDQFIDYREYVLGLALAFSAGVFLCISLGDLLPEVHFHSHDRVQLSIMLLVGVVIAFGIEMLPGHEHSDDDSSDRNEKIELSRQNIDKGYFSGVSEISQVIGK